MKHIKIRRKKSPRTADRKKLKLSVALFKGGYVHNTVLTQLAGVCSIAAAATSFKNSLLLSASFTVVLLACEILACALFKGVARWIRVCTYTVISVIFLIPIFSLFNENAITSLGVYLTLLCVNGIVIIRCEKFSVRTTVRNATLDAIAASVGYCAVAIIVGIVREFIAYGSIFGVKAGNLPVFSAMAMPFGGLIVLGFLAAIQKWSVKKFFPGEITDTFNLSGAFEKPVLKDPGINRHTERKKTIEHEEEIREYEKIKPRYSIEDIETAHTAEKEDEE